MEDLTQLAIKWGRSTALLGPPGRASAYGVHMVRG
jgi:hypothetical protein